jgi:molybdate transport system substrate-binding protein
MSRLGDHFGRMHSRDREMIARWVAACSAAIGISLVAANAEAAEIKVISANGPRAVLAGITGTFERATGHKLAITVIETGEIRHRILSGALYDVIILPSGTADELAKAGKIVAGTMMPIIRTSFGMAVRTGEPRPDVSSADAFKRSLLAAKSILITDPSTGGISGVHFMSVLDRLGITDAMKPKLVLHRGSGYHAERIARREADLAVQAEHEIRCVPGIEFVPYPTEFQRVVSFTAGVGADPKEAAGLPGSASAPASHFIQFLRGPEALAAIKAKCLQPG